ncbi:hypothetical protein ACFL2T_07245 [Elusimicrobiota bacterium]
MDDANKITGVYGDYRGASTKPFHPSVDFQLAEGASDLVNSVGLGGGATIAWNISPYIELRIDAAEKIDYTHILIAQELLDDFDLGLEVNIPDGEATILGMSVSESETL